MPAIGPETLAIARKTRCNVFVESGTYYAASFEKAQQSGVFERCYTVEIVPELYERAAAQFPARPDRQVFLGKSHEVFAAQIFPRCSASDRIFFWLDGHFSAGVTGGAEYPCPLLDELEAIRQDCPTRNVVIAIDDAGDLGRTHNEIAGYNWPTRADTETAAQAISPALITLDHTGAGTAPRIARGLLIFSYRQPGSTVLFEAVLRLKFLWIERARSIRSLRRWLSRARRALQRRLERL